MKLMEDNKTKIILEYNNGLSIAKLAKIYDVSQWSIKNLLDKNNIKTRTLEDLKIKFNESFFFAESPETYYFWGFMLGDGCLITHKQGHKYITISLKNTDKCILLQFCNWLNIDPIHIKTGINNCKTNYVRLEIYGKFFQEHDFSKYGLVSNKTNNPSKLDIPKEYVKPFLIGFIDADGSIAFNTEKKNGKYISKEYNFSIVGHPYNIDWFISQINQMDFTGNINYQIIKNKWKRARIQKKKDIIDLSKILEIEKYYPICLKRKWINLNL